MLNGGLAPFQAAAQECQQDKTLGLNQATAEALTFREGYCAHEIRCIGVMIRGGGGGEGLIVVAGIHGMGSPSFLTAYYCLLQPEADLLCT